MLDTTVTHDGIKFKIEYKVHGKYIPESREYPEEHPEIEVISIKVDDSDVELIDWMSFDLQDEFDNLVQESLEI